MSLRVEYRRSLAAEPLSSDTLAVIGFGQHARLPGDVRAIRVPLEPLQGSDLVEVWRGDTETGTHTEPGVRLTANRDHAFGVVEIHERDHADIGAATTAAYATIRRLQQDSRHPYILRMWNYLDAINHGTGDEERYKQFCLGRARTLGSGWPAAHFPAATAIGRPDQDPQGRGQLQIFWLAGRQPGEMLENPRQVSAFQYPRQYGPAAPTFSRAVLLRDTPLLMISGTASIVGHASLHPGDLLAQCAETLANLRSVLQCAQETGAALDEDLGSRSLLKVYLREAASAPRIDAFLRENLQESTPRLILNADICREDLLVEIDCLHGGSPR